jgi:hypothetical protein
MFYLKCKNCNAVTPHSHVGHFELSDDAKLVYECGRCYQKRVWGSCAFDRCTLDYQIIEFGCEVDPISDWSWLPSRYQEAGHGAR